MSTENEVIQSLVSIPLRRSATPLHDTASRICKKMKYTSELKPKAIKDLKSIPPKERERIVTRIERMEEDLQGDVN